MQRMIEFVFPTVEGAQTASEPLRCACVGRYACRLGAPTTDSDSTEGRLVLVPLAASGDASAVFREENMTRRFSSKNKTRESLSLSRARARVCACFFSPAFLWRFSAV